MQYPEYEQASELKEMEQVAAGQLPCWANGHGVYFY